MFYYLTVLRAGFSGFFEMLKSISVGKYHAPVSLAFQNKSTGVSGPGNLYGHGIGTGF